MERSVGRVYRIIHDNIRDQLDDPPCEIWTRCPQRGRCPGVHPVIAILLCAGAGSRLLPLTQEMPKCLVEVGGQTILDSQLQALRLSGIDRALVIGGYRANQIADHLARHTEPLSVDLVFNPFWAVSSSIGSVWAARDRLDGPFCILNGDTLLDPMLLREAVRRAQAGVNLLVEPIGEAAQDDMRVSVVDGAVRAVSKALPLDTATHRSLGVILSTGANDDYRRALDAVIAKPDGIQAYHHDIIDHLAREARVNAIVVQGAAWQEIDTPEDIANWAQDAAPLRHAI